MAKSLSDRLQQTRDRLHRVVIVHGICWLVAGALAISICAGLVDWFLHVSSEMRLLFLLLLCGSAGWLMYRYLLQPLRVPISDLDLAWQLERSNPQLGERLSSTVDFLNLADDDPNVGSEQLRRRVIESAISQTQDLNFSSVIRTRPASRAGLFALVITGIAGVSIWVNPSNATTALLRLVHPFGETAWPLRTRLRVVLTPTKIAKGDPFSVEVEVDGEIPQWIHVLYRFEDGQQPPPQLLRETRSGLYRGRLESVTRPFEYSIEGGDARIDWTPVEVVPAPEVTSLRLTLSYPEYTRLEDETYPDGRGHVKAVVGTKVFLFAQSNKPLARAQIHGIDPSSFNLPPSSFLSEDGTEVRAQFTVRQNGSYCILLDDREGMKNYWNLSGDGEQSSGAMRKPKSYRVQAVADARPEVVLEKPVGDQEVTAQARVPIRALIRDDFGVASGELRYTLSGSETGISSSEVRIPILESQSNSKRQIVEHQWDLAPLKLRRGSIVRFRVAALDFHNDPAAEDPEARGRNLGLSREIELRVVSEEEFLHSLDNEQQRIREQLGQILRLQEASLNQVKDLQKQIDIVGKLKTRDIEKLQAAEMNQRQVREKLADSEYNPRGLRSQIDRMLEKLVENEVQDLQTPKRLQLIRSELGRIVEQHLPPITQSLTRARKLAKNEELIPQDTFSSGPAGSENESKAEKEPQPGPQANEGTQPTGPDPDQPNPGPDLERAGEHQQQVVHSLTQMLDQLDEWEDISQVTKDAQELRKRQAELRSQVEKIAVETLGKQAPKSEADPFVPEADSEKILSPEQRAEIAKAAARQDDNRDQLTRLQIKMGRIAQKAAQEDETSSEILKGALEMTRQNNLAGKMADNAKNIRQNKMGDAQNIGHQIDKALSDLVDFLENRREAELTLLVKQLKEAEKDLQSLQEEQRRLLRKTQEAQKISDTKARQKELKRLHKRQQELREKAEEFARRLSKLRAQQASRSTGRAAGRMDRAGQQLRQGQQEQAEQKQQEALEELREAQQQLAKARQQAEQELAEEQLGKIADVIRQIYQRQMGYTEEIIRLDDLRKTKKRWTRGQMQSIASLSRAQSGLAKEAQGLTEKLSAAKVFVLVIEQAIEKMIETSGLLKKRQTGESTQRAAVTAAKRFAQLLESLRPDRNQDRNVQQGQQGGSGGGGASDGIPSIAQIKLLKIKQLEINDRTMQLAELRQKNDEWTAEDEKEFERISQDQGRLADLIRDLSKPVPEPIEEEGDLFQ